MMDTSFEILLAALQDESQPMPIDDLVFLSDLDQDRHHQFALAWNHLSAIRKRDEAHKMAEANRAFSHYRV